MTTLDRYLRSVLVGHFAVALATLLAIFSVLNLTEELQTVGTGAYSLAGALRFVTLTLPSEAYELFATTALLGGVTGLGSLAAHNEIVAAAAGGVSPARILLLTVRNAGWLALAAVLLGELVVPPLAQHAYADRSVRLSGGSALESANGLWFREGTRFVNVRTPTHGGNLRDVSLYEFDAAGKLTRVVRAERAVYADGRWSLESASERRILDHGEEVRQVPSLPLDSFLRRKQLRLFLLPPDTLSSLELLRSIRSLRERGENTGRHELALWKRIVTPFATLAMVFLALPFVLDVGNTASLGRRIVIGAMAGIGYHLASQTFAQAGLVYGLPPLFTSALPVLLAVAAGAALLRFRLAGSAASGR